MDFAYAVHTDVGHHCVAVKINHELMPLRTELRNGDHVEIITAANAAPNAAWLNFAVTGKARSHIRQYLRTAKAEESAQLGRNLLENAVRALNPEAPPPSPLLLQKLLRETGAKSSTSCMRRSASAASRPWWWRTSFCISWATKPGARRIR